MVKVTSKWEGLDEWEASETQWQEDVIRQTIEEIEKTALRIERDAKLAVPVDTGDLRGSITTDVNSKGDSVSAEIGTDIEYSDVVEFGGIHQRAQPYLIPSFDNNVTNLEETISKILRG